jgi:hypothetical protein
MKARCSELGLRFPTILMGAGAEHRGRRVRDPVYGGRSEDHRGLPQHMSRWTAAWPDNPRYALYRQNTRCFRQVG